MIRNSLFKILAIMLVIGLNWLGLSAVVETVAYYNDTENSSENVFVASTLDFSLNSPADFSPAVLPTQTASRNINLTNDGLLGFNYNVSATNTVGVLCNHLNLTAKLEGNDVYTGTISGFNYNAGEFSSTTDEWQFTANLTSNDLSLQNQTCHFDFVFNGTQIGDAGFSDQEIISNTINSGAWQKIVINKVYYDVDANYGAEGDNEWIEIYNPGDAPIDISGWKIVDNYATDTIPVSNAIPAHGFAVITGNASAWGYWNIPADVIKIVLPDGKIGNGLANDDDRVILKMPNGAEVDAMSYGTDKYAFDPACPDVSEGHILGRVPTGIDTNTASDWHDLGLPTVSMVNPIGGEVWSVGHYYDVKWTAHNSNGDDSALKISLWYSNDSGSTWAEFASNLDNTGIYHWRLPLLIGSYYVPSHNARIRAIAVGPENFMVQAIGSSRDFCPPIDYSLLTPEELEYLKEMGMIETEIIIEEATTTPEIISEEIPVLEESPAVEEISPVIKETPPAIEENPPVIEQAPVQEDPVPPPPPEPELTPNPTPDPNL